MKPLAWIWDADHYWPAFLITTASLFLIREIWSLATGRPQDSLSYYAWRQLNIVVGQSPSQWGAAAYLTFGMYVVVTSWLGYHIWFHKFTGTPGAVK